MTDTDRIKGLEASVSRLLREQAKDFNKIEAAEAKLKTIEAIINRVGPLGIEIETERHTAKFPPPMREINGVKDKHPTEWPIEARRCYLVSEALAGKLKIDG